MVYDFQTSLLCGLAMFVMWVVITKILKIRIF